MAKGLGNDPEGDSRNGSHQGWFTLGSFHFSFPAHNLQLGSTGDRTVQLHRPSRQEGRGGFDANESQ